MRLAQHIGKVSWAMGDKFLFIIYGLIVFVQISIMQSEKEVGLYGLLTSTANYIFVIADAFALQGLIQFGALKENRPQVDLIATLLFLAIALVGSMLVFLFSGVISHWLGEPAFNDLAAWLPLISVLAFPKYFAIKFLYRDYKFRDVFLINFAYFGTFTFVTIYYYFFNQTIFFSDMVYLYLAGTGAGSLVATAVIFRDVRFAFFSKSELVKYVKFGFPMSIVHTISSFPKVIDQYILGAVFNTSTVGVYFSAKTLFRVFDEASNASYGLVYPGTVKLLAIDDREGIRRLFTKAVSFLFMTFFVLVIALNLGLTKFIIDLLLPERFLLAVNQFNILSFNALGLPFVMIGIIIVARNEVYKYIYYNVVAIVASLAAYFVIAQFRSPDIISLGLTTYTYTLGILSFYYIKRHYGFPIKDVFRAFTDTINFLKQILNKNRNS